MPSLVNVARRAISFIAWVAFSSPKRLQNANMYYDLNVPYTLIQADLQPTLAFLSELGYSTIALNHSIIGKVPAEIRNPIPPSLPFAAPSNLKILRRCTLHLSDPGQNHRLSQLSPAFDIFALRPTNEKALQQACHALECDIISLDFSLRHPFHFQMKTMKVALDRGIKFEICYGPGILNADGGASRRNLIGNATQLIRATRGRGIIISSEAKRALACRSPADVINLAVMWGLQQARAAEAVEREARSVVAQSEMKRKSFRGVIDVVYGGEEHVKPLAARTTGSDSLQKGKRKADVLDDHEPSLESSPKPISKKEQKRRAHKARQEAAKLQQQERGPISHELADVQAANTNGEPG